MTDPLLEQTANRTVEWSLRQLVEQARALAARSPRTVLGIVGAPGAGKTTVCAALEAELAREAVIVPMDGFHLDDSVLNALGRRQRKGATDTFDVPGYVALLRRLREVGDDVVYAPRFDRSLEASRGSAIPVEPSTPLVITEGLYLLHDGHGWGQVRPQLDHVWFLDVDPAERRRRLVGRRMAGGEDEATALAWVTGVDEPNGVVVDASRHAADIIIRLLPEQD